MNSVNHCVGLLDSASVWREKAAIFFLLNTCTLVYKDINKLLFKGMLFCQVLFY